MALIETSEWAVIARDAFSSEGKSPRERAAMLADLLSTADAISASLSEEERMRRARIASLLDPRPEPWWKNFRAEALAEYRCQTSST